MVTFSQGSFATQPVIPSDRSLVHEHELSFPGDHRVLIGRSYVAWGAVTAGALTALSLLLLSSSFAYACGIPAYRGGEFGVGAAVWAILSSILAFFVGGCLVSYLAPHSEQRSGLVHGMLAWVLGVMLLSVLSVTAFGLFRGMMDIDTFRLVHPVTGEVTHAQLVGAAWTAFLSLFFGLIFAAIGGVLGFSGKLAHVEEKVVKP